MGRKVVIDNVKFDEEKRKHTSDRSVYLFFLLVFMPLLALMLIVKSIVG